MANLLPDSFQNQLEAIGDGLSTLAWRYPRRTFWAGVLVILALILALRSLPNPPSTDDDAGRQAIEQRAHEGLLGT